ncbi:MAG: T9SS type A sorting domain-containing protein [Bacteroidales bacterium]|nr:T9SS type A sorting domain-containing protein [Bacteroidales bacterium]
MDDTNDTISFTIIFNGSPLVGPSLQMLTVDGVVLENGTNIEVLVEDLDAFETVSDEYFIRNNSTNDVSIRMRMEAVILVDSTEYSFCALGNCFPPGINETTYDYRIDAGVTVGGEGVFTGHYHAHGHEGTSLIRYTFYNVDDLNDTISFNITFNGGSGEGIADIRETVFLNAFPNPSDGYLNIRYDIKNMSHGQLLIYNAVGAQVYVEELNSSSTTLNFDLTSFPKGVYLYKIEYDQTQSKTYKLVLR